MNSISFSSRALKCFQMSSLVSEDIVGGGLEVILEVGLIGVIGVQ